MVSPGLFVLLAFSFVLEIDFSLILLDLNDGVDEFLQSSGEVVGHWEILVGLCLLQLPKTVLPGISN